jgi:hypothetical protein
MSNIVTRSSVVFLVIAITSCSTVPVPAWVEGKSAHYTKDNYLLGHGVGQNEEVAEDNASRKITQQFKSTSSSDEFNPQTRIIFNQIEFEQPWTDTDSSEIHVLAYISRNKAASFIYSKMLALDELTYQFFELAKKTTDLLEQTSYINSAINAQTKRIDLKPILKIITSENDIPSEYNIERLSKIRDQLQARINLLVEIKNTKDTLGGLDLDTVIKSSLDTAGFIRNEKKSSKNRLLVELKIEESPISQTTDEFFMQGSLITTLIHQGDNSERGQYKWTFNATAKDHDSLVLKAQNILSTQLNAKLKHVLMDMMIIEYHTDDNVPNQDYVDVDMPEFNSNDDSQSETKKETSTTDTKQTKTDSTTASQTEKSTSSAVIATPVKVSSPEKTSTTSDSIKADPAPDKNPVEPSSTIVDDPISTLPALAN